MLHKGVRMLIGAEQICERRMYEQIPQRCGVQRAGIVKRGEKDNDIRSEEFAGYPWPLITLDNNSASRDYVA